MYKRGMMPSSKIISLGAATGRSRIGGMLGVGEQELSYRNMVGSSGILNEELQVATSASASPGLCSTLPLCVPRGSKSPLTLQKSP